MLTYVTGFLGVRGPAGGKSQPNACPSSVGRKDWHRGRQPHSLCAGHLLLGAGNQEELLFSECVKQWPADFPGRKSGSGL
jgi:hypothetical protein